MAVVDRLDRISRRQADKFAERRLELARATLQTLSQLGYARTSLREIAQNSEFSHGVLHYYFSDKFDLIICSVRDYKAHCVKRYDQITADAASYDELIDLFLAGLGATLRDDGLMHRLWYDLRAQALFETAFRADVMEIEKSLEAIVWHVMTRAAELGRAPLKLPSPVVFATFDGLFQQGLLRHLAGDANAIADMQEGIRRFLPACLTPRSRRATTQSPSDERRRVPAG
jgi:AcrR family transcriptional regulator